MAEGLDELYAVRRYGRPATIPFECTVVTSGIDSSADQLDVREISGNKMIHRNVRWVPKLLSASEQVRYPQPGDKALVLLADTGQPWVIEWSPSGTGTAVVSSPENIGGSLYFEDNARITFRDTLGRYSIDSLNGSLRFYTENTDGTGGFVRATLDRVGKLTVSGEVLAQGNLKLADGLYGIGGVTPGHFQFDSASDYIFRTGSVEKARISSTGVITAASSVNAGYGAGSGNVAMIPGNTGNSGYIQWVTPDGLRQGYMGFNANGGGVQLAIERGNFHVSGMQSLTSDFNLNGLIKPYTQARLRLQGGPSGNGIVEVWDKLSVSDGHSWSSFPDPGPGGIYARGNISTEASVYSGLTNRARIGNHPTYGTGYAAFWRDGSDYALLAEGVNTYLNAPATGGKLLLRTGNVGRVEIDPGNTAVLTTDLSHTGSGFSYIAGAGLRTNNASSNLHLDPRNPGGGTGHVYMNWYAPGDVIHGNGMNAERLRFTTAGDLRFNTLRGGIVGVYDATNTQAVFAMGDAYKLDKGNASGTYGVFYGLAWSYNPDYGAVGNNPQSKAGLNHQLLLMQAGVTTFAAGSGIWTSGRFTTTSTDGIFSGIGQMMTGYDSWLRLNNGSAFTSGLYIGGRGVDIASGLRCNNYQVGGVGLGSDGTVTIDSNRIHYATSYRISPDQGEGTALVHYGPGFAYTYKSGWRLALIDYPGSGANSHYLAGAYALWSDKSLKENIRALDDPVDKLMAVSGRRHAWVGPKEIEVSGEMLVSNQETFGFIAQDVESVLPEVVDFEPIQGVHTLDYMRMVPVLWEATKKAVETIRELRTRIEVLESN